MLQWVSFIGRHPIVFYGIGVAIFAVGAFAFSSFVYTHDRLPHGSGEVWNWIFGLDASIEKSY